MSTGKAKIKIEFPEYWSDFSALRELQAGVSVLTERHVAALRAAWTDLHAIYAAKTKRKITNREIAKKPRGQRVPDSEASARTLARRKAKAA